MLTVSVAYHANLERDVGVYIFTQRSLDNRASAYVNVTGHDNNTGEVKVKVGDVVRHTPINRYKPKFKTNARTIMDICANNFPAAALAQILDRIIPDKILVPAKQANLRVRLRSRNSTVSRIVKSSGFVMKR